MIPEFTQKQIEDYRSFRIRNNDYETGLSREERFIINKIHSQYLEKLENRLNEKEIQ